jgi:hypothetical protein
LKASDEVLDLTASEYECWLSDYVIMASYMLRMEPPLPAGEHSDAPRVFVTVSPVVDNDGFRKATEIFQQLRGPSPHPE